MQQSISTAMGTSSLVDTADIVGGFSTLAAVVVALVAVPVAFLEARRQKELARLERVSEAIQSYLDRRSEIRNPDFVDWADTSDDVGAEIINFPIKRDLEDCIFFVEFAIKRLDEVGKTFWRKQNISFVDLLGRDLEALNEQNMMQAISSYIASNSCKEAARALGSSDPHKAYDWDEDFEADAVGGYPNRCWHDRVSPDNEEEWETYCQTEEFAIRLKRRLHNGLLGHQHARQDFRKADEHIDRLRADLNLPPLHRNEGDYDESEYNHDPVEVN